ncbi:hypothetical protein [Jidongwangia harbinensis]|uniref:hypothetical protein n=1 Tax=Jidongwangia harbinensis TaxID=2878561 RepID=UPI001CDA5555|nr:hypothetical protein [Jidongwangia harbinensis]MCA2211436.1 hypothetical protein [Jidongwangia harbinensis]
MNREWASVPIGIDADRWVSRGGCRTVLAVAHTVVSCQRLLDVVDLIETDPRVQVVFTVAPDVFNHGVDGYLRELGALVVPWAQATRESFHLALAASSGGLTEIHAPVVLMAHGAGHGKTARPPSRGGPIVTDPPVYGLEPQELLRAGRVLPSALLLAHRAEREILRRQCPPALAVAVVTGDICYDRLLLSLSERDRYRHALGIGNAERLVVVSSTWGRDGSFGAAHDLLPRLMTGLPAGRYRVAALLHPAIWAHGVRQVRAWTGDCRAAGLILPAPTEDWRALVAAADHVIGDHGSVTAYAAAAGLPTLRLDGDWPQRCAPGTAQHLVGQKAGRLRLDDPLEPQLRDARPLDTGAVAARVTSHPGQAGERLRRVLYRLLHLSPPGRHRRVEPVPVP